MSFGLWEMSFGILEMSFGILKMSFDLLKMSFDALEMSFRLFDLKFDRYNDFSACFASVYGINYTEIGKNYQKCEFLDPRK